MAGSQTLATLYHPVSYHERLISSAIGIAPMPYHMVVVVGVGSGRSIHNSGAECVWQAIATMLAGEVSYLSRGKKEQW